MFPSHWDTIFGVSSLLCFLLGTTGNILAASYFLTRPVVLSPNTLLHICINLTDILICSLALFTGLVNLSPSMGETLFNTDPLLCNVWGILWNVTIRVSVYLIAVLSVSRLISIYLPHKRMSLWSVAVPIVTYVFLMLLQAATPFFRGTKYEYFPRFKVCSWDLGKVFVKGSPPFNVLYFLLNIVEFVFPLIPVTSCCCFIILKLRFKRISSSSSSSTAGSTRRSTVKREATITIVLLTITYLVWNVPLCIVLILNYITQVSELQSHDSPGHYHFQYHVQLRTFMNSQTIVLNCVCNTCLYFYRITGLRRWTRDLMTHIFCRVFRCRVVRELRVPTTPILGNGHSRSYLRPGRQLETAL